MSIPDRSDYYLMQLTAEVIRPNLKKGSTIDSKKLKITFEPSYVRKEETKKDIAWRSHVSRMMWCGAVGMKAFTKNEQGEVIPLIDSTPRLKGPSKP